MFIIRPLLSRITQRLRTKQVALLWIGSRCRYVLAVESAHPLDLIVAMQQPCLVFFTFVLALAFATAVVCTLYCSEVMSLDLLSCFNHSVCVYVCVCDCWFVGLCCSTSLCSCMTVNLGAVESFGLAAFGDSSTKQREQVAWRPILACEAVCTSAISQMTRLIIGHCVR